MKGIKYLLIVLLVVSAITSCNGIVDDIVDDIVELDPVDTSYTLTITNGTGGKLKNVSIDATICGSMAAGDTCSATYTAKPATVTISKESDSPSVTFVSDPPGNTFNADIIITPGVASTEDYNIVLPSDLYALQVKASVTGQELKTFDFNILQVSPYTIEHTTILLNYLTVDGLYHFIGFMDINLTDNLYITNSFNTKFIKYAPVSISTNIYGSKYFETEVTSLPGTW